MKLETMTVGELKAYLEQFPENTLVVFSHPAHDYWHTILVGTISEALYADARYSQYHKAFYVVEEDGEEGEEERVKVLVLG